MKTFQYIFFAVLLGFTFYACDTPKAHPDMGPAENRGTLTITVNDGVSRTISPSGLSTSYYLVEGSGPDSATFSTSTSGSLTLDDLLTGEWLITVTAFNSDDIAVGAGSATTSVYNDYSSSVSITVIPLAGAGSLNLTVEWIDEQVYQPQVVATLTSLDGTSRSLGFSNNGAQAGFYADDIAAGYHTLSVRLLDDGFLNASTVAIVWIVKDLTSSYTFSFDEINQATGSIDVEITPEMGDPLDIEILGAEASKPVNRTLPLYTGSTHLMNQLATFTWYVNGVEVATGLRFAFNDSWPQGYYRIDVTAISEDGTRAGSTHAYIEVVEPDLSPNVPFISQWDMTLTETNTLVFPLFRYGTYDFTIDWGDGTVESKTYFEASHTYSTAAIYNVTVTGRCEGFGFGWSHDENNEKNLIDIIQWGDVKLNNSPYKFGNCINLTGFSATDAPDLEGVTNVSFMFAYATSFNDDISDWDISDVTDVSAMFCEASLFNQDISDWDTSNVTRMTSLFYKAGVFNQNISDWDTSNVLNMSSMFSDASSFTNGGNPAGLESWIIKDGCDQSSMFDGVPLSPLPSWYTP